ncbi:MAG: glycoside hydrolase family 1 protein [Deltaproteobacteria bacterium]|nr:glycoside hydrolase family 1 protein [Candidatus Zymogenaceae bacterium]
MDTITFPKRFLWGGATSSHQIEGGNFNNDWWAFEQVPGHIIDGKISGDACDHYHRFREDFALLKGLNHNAHRLSLEWSRIEPAKGYFSAAAIEHYIEVIKELKRLKITPIVTLHHFSTPLWMAREGGWLNPACIDRFAIFTKAVASALGKDVRLWMTINEPMVYAFFAYITGEHAPGVKSPLKGFRVARNMLLAHARAYHAIKEIDPTAQVGFAKHMRVFEPYRQDNTWDAKIARNQDKAFNMDFIDALFTGESSGNIKVKPSEKELVKGNCDFIGLNYYARDSVKFSLLSPSTLFGKTVPPPPGMKTSHFDVGEYYPHGIYRLLSTISQYGVPLYVTENGVATVLDEKEKDDRYRREYMAAHIYEVGKALKDGMDIRGYLFWSSFDNFEWAEGYTMRFGMIHVDYETQKRTIKPSGKLFSEIAKTGVLSPAMLKKYGVAL